MHRLKCPSTNEIVRPSFIVWFAYVIWCHNCAFVFYVPFQFFFCMYSTLNYLTEIMVQCTIVLWLVWSNIYFLFVFVWWGFFVVWGVFFVCFFGLVFFKDSFCCIPGLGMWIQAFSEPANFKFRLQTDSLQNTPGLSLHSTCRRRELSVCWSLFLLCREKAASLLQETSWFLLNLEWSGPEAA